MPGKSDSTRMRLARLAASECLNFGLRKADRAVSQAYDRAIAASGLKSTQFTLLNAVALGGGIGISALAEAMVMDRTTLTRNLAPLERDGLIETVPGPDRRTRSVAITRAGIALLDEALPLWHAEHRRLKRALGARPMARLLDQLHAVIGIAAR